jgi:hypothetical protein
LPRVLVKPALEADPKTEIAISTGCQKKSISAIDTHHQPARFGFRKTERNP